jgi:hypothetical protein
MSYGQNQPAGLVSQNTTTSAIYNGQNRRYFIQSGYANNIFRGDLVYLGADGFIHNLSDLQAANYPTAQALGVFNGCSYVQPTAANPTDPASPGRPFCPGGTVTSNGTPATCDILDDPWIVYSIQADAGGVPWDAQGATAPVGYTYVPASVTNAAGNTLTGQSSLVLNSGQIGVNAAFNLRIIGFDPNPSNPIPLPAGGPSPYVNVLVLIQNSSFVVRPVGL